MKIKTRVAGLLRELAQRVDGRLFAPAAPLEPKRTIRKRERPRASDFLAEGTKPGIDDTTSDGCGRADCADYS